MSTPTRTAGVIYEKDDNFSHRLNTTKLEESDEDDDMFMVPNVENETTDSANNVNNNSATNAALPTKRRRGRNPVDREHKRLKRLLRNRVSAQQARERKKVYVTDLELKSAELEETNSNLEEKISTLTNENTMLRKVLLNSTRPKIDQNTDIKHDQLGKR